MKIEKAQDLVSIVYDAWAAECDQRKFNQKVRKKLNISRGGTIWVGSMTGGDACRMGELTERCDKNWSTLAIVCKLMDFDQERLISIVKSMRRWETHGGRWDRDICPTACLNDDTRERLFKFIMKDKPDTSYYNSTGRKKAWCK